MKIQVKSKQTVRNASSGKYVCCV